MWENAAKWPENGKYFYLDFYMAYDDDDDDDDDYDDDDDEEVLDDDQATNTNTLFSIPSHDKSRFYR